MSIAASAATPCRHPRRWSVVNTKGTANTNIGFSALMHVLGIDAGGTKTVCLLADERGAVVAEGRGPGANLHTAGELAVEKVLHEAMEAAIGDRAIAPAAICLGIAGVDREDEMLTVRAVMRRIGYKSRVLV